MQLQKAKAILLSLVPVFSTASLIALSVVTMPLVTSQPASAETQIKTGPIFDKWASLGGPRGVGNPTTDELSAARGGRYNEFQYGYIYWHPNTGAHAVYGQIGQKWNQIGRENGVGYPLIDERPAANGGRYNQFEYGFIYWHPQIGPKAVYGHIGRKWNETGRETGSLGYPISDEEDVVSGGKGLRVSKFQKGEIYWNPGTGKVTVTYK